MFEEYALQVPHLLLPDENSDMSKWAVIACDQFTQDAAYWQEVEALVGDAPSTLRITLPEINLADAPARIPAIHGAMGAYAAQVLTRRVQGMVLVRRDGPSGRRLGLMAAVDLEKYDYTRGARSLIRATEGTIVDRLPPRMAVRRGAPLEAPHILLLLDDPGETVIEPIAQRAEQLEMLYDFDLMMGGGHITGWLVEGDAAYAQIEEALKALASPQAQEAKYGEGAKDSPLLFAAGDGNHSLATAKACWEELKPTLSPEQQQDHPARYALVEIGNLHDPQLHFAPIHRVVFGVDTDVVLADLAAWAAQHQGAFGGQTLRAVTEQGGCEVFVPNAPHELEVGTLQMWLDDYVKRTGVEIDYVHGDEESQALGRKQGNVAFLLPAIQKSSLFREVHRTGALPRKTFSMGEAQDKRYYLECRSIVAGQ